MDGELNTLKRELISSDLEDLAKLEKYLILRKRAVNPDWNKKEVVYRWGWSCRAGDLDGIFVSRPDIVELAFDRMAYFGDVLGKYSNIHFELKPSQFETLSDDLNVVEFVKRRGRTGYNPLNYAFTCEYCGEPEIPGSKNDLYDCEECGTNTLCKKCKEFHLDCHEKE